MLARNSLTWWLKQRSAVLYHADPTSFVNEWAIVAVIVCGLLSQISDTSFNVLETRWLSYLRDKGLFVMIAHSVTCSLRVRQTLVKWLIIWLGLCSLSHIFEVGDSTMHLILEHRSIFNEVCRQRELLLCRFFGRFTVLAYFKVGRNHNFWFVDVAHHATTLLLVLICVADKVIVKAQRTRIDWAFIAQVLAVLLIKLDKGVVIEKSFSH